VSPATRAFVASSGTQATHPPSNAESAARRRAVLTQITQGVASVLQSLHTGVPRSHVESHVQGLLATFNLSAPVPHLKVLDPHYYIPVGLSLHSDSTGHLVGFAIHT